MKQLITALFVIFMVITIVSCEDNSLEKQRQNELEILDAYIQETYPDAKPKSSGLYYIEEVKGTGDSIVVGDVVQIYYGVYGLDSVLYDQTNGFSNGQFYDPIEFTVIPASQLSVESAELISDVPGLHEALTYMQLNSTATLILNSGLAFGQNGTIYTDRQIPGFTTIRVKVKIYKVK